MASTLVGIIHDSETGQVQAVIIPTDDSELSLHVGKGQNLITVKRNEYLAMKNVDIQNKALAALGLPNSADPPPPSVVIDRPTLVAQRIAADKTG